MNLASKIKQLAFKNHVLMERLGSAEHIKNFINRFKEKYVAIHLTRIGGNGDGGYLLPNNFDGIQYCFSPGVDYTAAFELELSQRFKIKSFLADASVDQPPFENKDFVFIKKFLGSRTNEDYITLSDWMDQNIPNEIDSNILQMDIEGAEYDVLSFESAITLSKFKYMIIEFHNLQNIFEKNFLRSINAIFEKIYLNFSICHVHPNNTGGIASLDGVSVPRVMEVTFIRNDLIDSLKSPEKISLPHYLDQKNVPNVADIVMPEIWWRQT